MSKILNGYVSSADKREQKLSGLLADEAQEICVFGGLWN